MRKQQTPWLVSEARCVAACKAVSVAALTWRAMFAQCAASLCSGLAVEDEFDVSLFSGACVDLSQESISTQLARLSSIRQRWIGFVSPVLEEVELLAILAFVRYAQLSRDNTEVGEHSPDVNMQGAVLHCGRSALQCKNAVQDSYRAAQAAATGSETGPSWETVAAEFLARAAFVLQHCGAIEDSWLPPVLRQSDAIVDWEQEHATQDHRCVAIDRVKKFIVHGPPAAIVRDRMQARSKSASEAALGYGLFRELLEAGIVHPSTGLLRASTIPERDTNPDAAETVAVAGTWSFAIPRTGAEGTVYHRPYQLEVLNQQLIGVSKLQDGFIQVDGRVDADGAATWVEQIKSKITCWVSGKFSNDGSFTGIATRSAADASKIKDVKLQASLVRAGHFHVGEGLHPALRGLSLTQRRIRLLQSATRAFDDVGPLADVDSEAQAASNALTKFVFDTLAESANQSEELMYWCCRFLICRLSDDSAIFCANQTRAARVVLGRVMRAEAFDFVRLDGNALVAQAAFVAALTVKLSATGNGESVRVFLPMLRSELSSSVHPAILRQMLAALHASCHLEAVREILGELSWSDLLWDIAGSLEMDIKSRLGAFSLICHTLVPNEANMLKLLEVTWATSPEARFFGGGIKQSWALAVRQNAALLVRHLCCDSTWRDLLATGLAATTTLDTTSWGLMSAVAMPDILGLGQPGSSLRSLDMETLGHVADAMCAGIFRSALSLPLEGQSMQSRILRSRALKIVYEIGTVQGFQCFATLLPSISSLAKEATNVPPGVSLEALLAKLRSLYACHGDITVEDAEEPSALVRTRSDEDHEELKEASQTSVETVLKSEIVAIAPSEEQLLDTTDKVERVHNTTSYVSNGAIKDAIAVAEDATAVFLSRLIVVSALKDQATSGYSYSLDGSIITSVLQHLFHVSDGVPKLRPICASRSLITLADLSTTVTHWLTTIPVQQREQITNGLLGSLDHAPSCDSLESNSHEDDGTVTVKGAGNASVNGQYRKQSQHNGKPLYRIESGTDAILYFNGEWKLSPSGTTSGWIYMKRGEGATPPSGSWQVASGASSNLPAPTISVGGTSKISNDSRTEVELRDDASSNDNSFTFWLLQHVLRVGWATTDFCFAACQRVLQLLFRAPASHRLIIAHALAHFSEVTLEKACVGNLRSMLIETTSIQLKAEAVAKSRLLWSQYTQCLLELVCKTNCARPQPEALSAHSQAKGLYALVITGHPNETYNAEYKPEEPFNGWPHFQQKSSANRHLFRHVQSGRWVFSYTTEPEDLAKPATITAPDGPVPVGEHTWHRNGEDVKITVTTLATQATFDEHIAAAEKVRRAALQEQLTSVAKVSISGVPHSPCNAIYLLKGERDGWMYFETDSGLKLFRHIDVRNVPYQFLFSCDRFSHFTLLRARRSEKGVADLEGLLPREQSKSPGICTGRIVGRTPATGRN